MTVATSLRVAPLVLMMSAGASAQTATPPEHEWSRGTTLNVFAGGAAASSTVGPLAGGAFGWELGPWIGIEGSGAWLRRNAGASAFTASLATHVNLTRPRAAVPFVRGGIGLYRASFDPERRALPDFYAHRVGTGPEARQAFTDPAFVAGGGVNVFATTRWAIRPQAEAIIVRRDGRHYTVGLMTVHLAYHFERHSTRAQRPPPR